MAPYCDQGLEASEVDVHMGLAVLGIRLPVWALPSGVRP